MTYIQMSIYFQKISNARAHQQTRKMAKWKGAQKQKRNTVLKI